MLFRIKYFLVLVSIFVANTNFLAQTRAQFDCKLCLKEVHFGGALDVNYITIYDDETEAPFKAPHYELDCKTAAPKSSLPVAYVSNTKAKVKAIFNSEDCDKDFYVRGKVENITINGVAQTIEFAEQKCVKVGNDYVYDFALASIKFGKNVVRYFPNFEIKWEVRYEGGTQWKYLASSVNKLYVTHKQPVLVMRDRHLEEPKVFHTLIEIGCRNADQSKKADEIVDRAFGAFTDPKMVMRVDGVGPIKYWGTWPDINPAIWLPSQMLKKANLNGRCGGWAPFFENVLVIQGITSSSILAPSFGEVYDVPGANPSLILSADDFTKMKTDVEAFFDLSKFTINYQQKPSVPTARPCFLVNKWSILADEKFVVADWYNNPYKKYPIVEMPFGKMGEIVKIREEKGLSGQGNDDPRSEFENHAVVEYKNKIYDPSYGTKFTSKEAWETASIAAMGAQFEVMWTEGSVMRALILIWIRNVENPSFLDLLYL